MLIVPAVLLCVVVGVTDGDTITARCDAGADAPAQTITVRLAEVDAPEKAQPYGNRSRQHLAALCFKQRAEVRPIVAGGTVDRYERVVAHVSCNGTNANAAQVRAGMAWAFPRYVTDGWLTVLAAGRRTSCAPWPLGRCAASGAMGLAKGSH
jgi:endonuclease YncB( thermonuclease family)